MVTHEPRRSSRPPELEAYFRIARSVRLLAVDEERHLLRQAQAGSRSALERLVASHVPLVLKHALQVARTFRAPPADLVQEGMLGLIEAVRHFDPSKDVRLSTYAIWWIRALLLRSVLANWRLVRVGTTKAQRAAFFDLQKERRLLERQGRSADLTALAQRIGVPEPELRELEHHLHTPEAALDAPDRAPGRTVADSLVDAEPLPDDQVEEHELYEHLRVLVGRFRAELPPRERELVSRRWLAPEPPPLRELGKQFGVSGERARQLEVQLLRRFHRFAQAEMGELDPPTLSHVA
jgi:RNA polymerase sigma-32 factor